MKPTSRALRNDLRLIPWKLWTRPALPFGNSASIPRGNGIRDADEKKLDATGLRADDTDVALKAQLEDSVGDIIERW